MHMCTHLWHPTASSIHWVQYETHLATSGVRISLLFQITPLTSLHKKVSMRLLAISLVYFDRVSFPTAVSGHIITSLVRDPPLGPYHVVLSLGQITIW